MKRFKEFKSKLDKVSDSKFLFSVVKQLVVRLEHLLIDYNVQDQLFEKGINAEGISLSSFAPYSRITVSIKRQKGQPTNRVTLKDEGDFYESFYIDARNTEFEIMASDSKTEELKSQYGESILGLTEENIDDFVKNYLKEEILKAIRNELF